jgi:3-hydroxyacyl-CoA dehydrogenase
MPHSHPDPTGVRRVAVLGAGTIGASWAAWFLSRGMTVAVSDPNPEAEAYVQRYVRKAWPTLMRLGMSGDASPDAWTFHASARQAVADAEFVQENAPERLPIKRALYAEIEAAMRPDAILASSSSGIMMTDMQDGLRTPARFAIGHPFNPPHLIPLVEVVGGRLTSPETVAWCLAFYNHIGKRAIHIRKEAPGHLANRLQAALWAEAISAVTSGLASVEDVDTAISAGPGLRWALMGPHQTFNLAGGDGGMTHFLNQFRPAFQTWWASMAKPELSEETGRALITGVEAAVRGRGIADLEAERDALLVAVMEAIARHRAPS